MNKERFMNMTDILNHGLGSQNKLSDLNKLVTARINAADYSHVHRLFEELLSIAGETDIKQMAQKEERLDGLCSDLSGIKIDLLKETGAQAFETAVIGTVHVNPGDLGFIERRVMVAGMMDDLIVAVQYMTKGCALSESGDSQQGESAGRRIILGVTDEP